MATIEYKFSDGHIEEIEVTEEFAKQYKEIDKKYFRNEEKFDWRTRNKEMSMERLQKEFGMDMPDDAPAVDEQVTTTKKWSIRAKVIENGKERDYRRTGFLNKKEAKLSWLDYLAVNQDEVLSDIAVNKTNFPAPVEIEDRKPFENSDSCNMLAVQPDELYQPTDNVYFTRVRVLRRN